MSSSPSLSLSDSHSSLFSCPLPKSTQRNYHCLASCLAAASLLHILPSQQQTGTLTSRWEEDGKEVGSRVSEAEKCAMLLATYKEGEEENLGKGRAVKRNMATPGGAGAAARAPQENSVLPKHGDREEGLTWHGLRHGMWHGMCVFFLACRHF